MGGHDADILSSVLCLPAHNKKEGREETVEIRSLDFCV